jgi:hypothetical protein
MCELSRWGSIAYDKDQTYGKLLVVIDKSTIQLKARICEILKLNICNLFMQCVQRQHL